MHALWLSLVLYPVPASAGVTLSSPVGGYCRIGKYTPVEIERNAASDVLIEGEGVFPVQLRGGPSATSILPVLKVAPPSGTIKVRQAGGTRTITLPFGVLSENERLVGLIVVLCAALYRLACDVGLLIRVWLGRIRVMKRYTGNYWPFGKFPESPKRGPS